MYVQVLKTQVNPAKRMQLTPVANNRKLQLMNTVWLRITDAKTSFKISHLLCDSMAVVPIHTENKSQMLVGINPLTSD